VASVVILFLEMEITTSAQSTTPLHTHIPALAAGGGLGRILATNPFVRGDNQLGISLNHYRFAAVKLLWQPPGYREWQQLLHQPYYGVGITMADFSDRAEVGYPVSGSGVLGIPLFRYRQIELYNELQFGLATNWNKYDSVTNPKNIAIGGNLAVHLGLGLNMRYQASDVLALGAGVTFLHFSNGGMERPNRGFNVATPEAELIYYPFKRARYTLPCNHMHKPGKNEFYIMVGYGNHQLVEHEFDTNYFAVGGLSCIAFRHFSPTFRLGAGWDANYWMGLTARPDGTIGKRNFDNLILGFIAQPELTIDRLMVTGLWRLCPAPEIW